METSTEDQKPANALSGCLARVETGLIALSVLAMAAIMLIVVLDVVMRYAFDAPLVWSYDLIGLYLVGIVVFFALSDTLHHHGHIALDIFLPLTPMRVRHGGQVLGYAASAALMGAIAWLEWGEAVDTFRSDNRIAALIPLPTWVAHAVLALGMTVLTLRCVYRVLGHGASAATGRDLVELPPPPITTAHAGEHGE